MEKRQKELALFGGEKALKEPLPTHKNRSGRTIGEEELEAVKEVLDVYGPEASSSAERQRLAISPIRPQAPVLVGTDPYNSVTLSLAPKDASRDMLLRTPSLLLDFGPGGDDSASLRLRPPPKLNFEIPE